MTDDPRSRFLALHREGCFLLPNPWDVGSAKLLESLGAVAIATTSSGLAASLGKRDQHLLREDLISHVAALTAAVEIPVNADSERLYADSLTGIAETIELLAEAGAAGCSIEDYDPATNRIDPVGLATDRVAAAAEAAASHRIVLTARAEGRLYGPVVLDEIISRLTAYRDAGAGAVYAPGLTDLTEISRVVEEVGAPVNVLALPGGPSVGELAAVGVRRVSTGGALAWAAYGALVRAAEELLGAGTSTYTSGALPTAYRAAFD